MATDWTKGGWTPEDEQAKTELNQSIAGLQGGQSFPTSGPQSFPTSGPQSFPTSGPQSTAPIGPQSFPAPPQAPRTAPVARPAAPVAPGSVPAPTAPTEAVSAAQAVMSEADRLATAGMNSVQRDEYLLQKAGGGAPAPTEPAGTPGAPAAPTGEFTDQNVRPTAQTQQDGTLGFAVGSKVLTPEQVAAMKPEDIAAEQRREATYNLSINKGLSTAQAEQAMAYAQQNGISPEQAISELGSRLTGQAALSAEQLAERATQEQQNIFENRKKEIDRVFEEQNAELNDAQKQAEGLARLNMAQAGSLFTATEGGYERAGKSADPYGPHTRLKQMVLKHEKNMGELRQRRQEAVNMAQDAMFAGKYAIARDLMNDARQAQQDTIALERQQREEQREEQEFAIEYAKGIRESALEEMNTLIAGGMEGQITEGYLRGIEKRMGAEPGFGQALLNISKSQIAGAEAKTQEDALKTATATVDLLNKIPAGKTIKIGDTEYTGLKTGDVATGVEKDQFGRATFWSFDKTTGEINTTSLGDIGKAEDGWSTVQTDQGAYYYNSKTNAFAPAQPSISQSAVQKILPEGTRTNPFRPGKGASGIQCGELMNDLNDPAVGRIWGDSLEQKLKVASDPKWSVPLQDVQEGDTIVQGGGWTGHVLRVLSRETLPNGREQITALEANYVPVGGGAVTSTRTLYLDDPKNKAAARVPTRPGIMGGTDGPPGGMPTIGGRPITEVFAKDEKLSVADAKALGVPFGTTRSDAERMGITPGASGAREDKLLSVTEAKALGLPYGTTQSEAAAKGITPGITTTGGNEAFNKLKPAQKESFLDLLGMQEKLGTMRELKEQVNTGPIRAGSQFLRGTVGAANENYLSLQAISQSLSSSIMKAISGAAISEQEAARLSKFIPSPKDQDQTFRSKLSTLIDEYSGLLDRKSRIYGFDGTDDFRASFGVGGTVNETTDAIRLKSPDGSIVEYDSLSPTDLQEAIDQGYVQQ